MKLPRRGEKGFTLIELLIVVAILGILAAVIVPNVSRFFGRGEEEARSAEKHSVQLAVAALMTDLGVSDLSNPPEGIDGEMYGLGEGEDGTNNMSVFPGTEDLALFDEFLHTQFTKYLYTVDNSGTVTQGELAPVD